MNWIVLVQPTAQTERAFGPFESRVTALRFAEFASEEIDAATVIPLTLPVFELLAWRDRLQGRDAYTEAVQQLLDSGLMTDLKRTAAPEPTRTADHTSTPERTRP